MARATYGPTVKQRSMRLLQSIVSFALGELPEDCDRVKISHAWVSDNVLRVNTTLSELVNLTKADRLGEGLKNVEVAESLNRMKDFLEILIDERVHDQGAKEWQFTLKLWSRETAENLRRFDAEWEARRSPKSKAVTVEPQVIRSLPDAPKGYVWVEAQLERARLQIANGKISLDFFDGSEATWLDMVAVHDVMRDVQAEILETVQQWCDRGDRMSMALIQGRSGDGKSTVLRRVATDLVGQDYSVLWYRGQGSLNREALEVLSEDLDLILCVDDLTKILPEEIEQTLRDLQAVSARVFWIVSVRDDLWGGMNLALRQVVKLSEFPVRRLSDREIEQLLDQLASYDALGMLAGLGRREQEARLREGADRQLLVALLEAKYNESLQEYVLRNLYELEQRFGKVVADACKLTCAVQRFGLELPIEHLQEILGILSPRGDIFSKTEGFLYPPSSISGHNGVHVRHGVIATTVFENDPAAYERLGQFIRADLHLKSRWEKWTPSLCHAIRLSMRTHTLDLDQVRQVFNPASEDVDVRKYVLNIWAILEKQAGNIDKARSLFEKGTQADPKHAPSWQAWALMERDQGNIDKARSLFKRATDENPNEIIYRGSWLTFEEQQNQTECLRNFHQHMTVLFPHEVKSWQAWATFERTQSNPDHARDLYQKATKINPDNVPSWQAWALLEKELGNYPKARDLFQSAVQVAPDRADVWQPWAIMEKELGNPDEARRLFKQATKVDPKAAAGWCAWVIFELEQEQYLDALQYAEIAVRCKPKDIHTRLTRGQAYQAMKRRGGEIYDFSHVKNKLQKRLKAHPNDNRDLNLLGRTFMLLGQDEEAEATLKRSLQVSSLQQKPYAHNGLGELYAAQGNREAAIEQWKKALELSPHYLPAKNNLTQIRLLDAVDRPSLP